MSKACGKYEVPRSVCSPFVTLPPEIMTNIRVTMKHARTYGICKRCVDFDQWTERTTT